MRCDSGRWYTLLLSLQKWCFLSVCNGAFELAFIGRFAAFEAPLFRLDAEEGAPDCRMRTQQNILIILSLDARQTRKLRVKTGLFSASLPSVLLIWLNLRGNPDVLRQFHMLLTAVLTQ